MNDFARMFGGAFQTFAGGMNAAGQTTGQVPPRRPDPFHRKPVATTPEGGLVYEVPRKDYQVLTILEEQPAALQALMRARGR